MTRNANDLFTMHAACNHDFFVYPNKKIMDVCHSNWCMGSAVKIQKRSEIIGLRIYEDKYNNPYNGTF